MSSLKKLKYKKINQLKPINPIKPIKPIVIDLLIVGSGGNGQSYFMEFCKNNNIKTNCKYDIDKLKHIYHPKLISNKYNIKKCIFIYNHPYKLILKQVKPY